VAIDVLSRIQSARAATVGERTARVRMATFAAGAEITSAPTVEAIGIGDLVSRCVLLESRPSEESLRLLRDLAVKAKREEEFDETELGAVELFVGNDYYTRFVEKQHWVRTDANWYWRPLWALDVLDAAAGDWRECEAGDIHGELARSYSGEIDAALLKQIDRHWREVLGRRGKGRLRLRVWLDQRGRALRVAWKLPAIKRRPSSDPSWYLSEFWDFGVPAAIDTPPPDLVQSPATLREMIGDLRAMRRAAKS
jgi:hypothetical protein